MQEYKAKARWSQGNGTDFQGLGSCWVSRGVSYLVGLSRMLVASGIGFVCGGSPSSQSRECDRHDTSVVAMGIHHEWADALPETRELQYATVGSVHGCSNAVSSFTN